ncbi:putative [Protein-PII] uridylyltransferase [Helianthus annuus]|nr:putative [Protein-PII] uridylyltransferase [Helianthus annuus]KAJ0718200.1 putative [Protein-PII] uridylyltransferase [Helianthus annuus]KAJ0721432.1 putative [Protein-PII] uridylyltransferase [Helianthus annuus]
MPHGTRFWGALRPFWVYIYFFGGLRLELYTTDRIGLLSYVTRIIRENSLTVTRAEVETRGDKAVDTFYVRDASGYSVDSKIICSVREQIGHPILKVRHNPQDFNRAPQESRNRFFFGGLFRFLYEQYLNS